MKKKLTENIKNSTVIKIVVTGAFNSGKTHFIRTISNNNMLYTEKSISEPYVVTKKSTTVAMDFAKVKLKDTPQLFFFGTPGQKRFDFMWEILSYKMFGCIIMVDSHKFYESFDDTRTILNYFIDLSTVPIVVVANKQDLPNALSPHKIKQELSLPKRVSVLPCIATEKDKVEEISRYLVNNIIASKKDL
ncbi:MAG: GTP-binding protein [Candidatus Firestonebacteria bacterium]|nr:GTP-binding protein [Candidatus Firestonebacteria bacterium]